MSSFFSFSSFISVVVPFLSTIFYPFWNAKVYFILNLLLLLSFVFFTISLYVKKIVNIVSGYEYLIYFLLLYILSFGFSPIKDIISAEYINFIGGFIVFTLALNSKDLNFRFYYILSFIILVIFLLDIFLDFGISLKGNTNLFAFVFIIIISIFLENKKYYTAIPFFIALLFTRSYGAILSIFIVSIIYLFNNFKTDELKKNKFIYIIFIILVFFIISNIEKNSIYDRLNWWKVAINIFYDRIFIGWGYSSFTHLFSAYSSAKLSTIYPHNFFLSILVEGGIFALLFFIIFLYKILRRIDGINRYVVLTLLFHSFFDIGLDTVCGWWFFMFYIGYSLKKVPDIIFLSNFNVRFFYSILIILFFLVFKFIFFSYSLIDIEKKIEEAIHLVSLSKYDDALNLINSAIKKYPSSIDLAKTRVFIYSKYINKNEKLFSHYIVSLEYLLILNPYQKNIYQTLIKYYESIDKKALSDIQLRKRYYIKYNE